MLRFDGKVVIVTGAASGIGESAARRFAAEGAAVMLADKNGAGLEKLAQSLGDRVTTCETDVSDLGSCMALVDATLG